MEPSPPERPDPIGHMRRLKEIFNEAAVAAPEAARPTFERLSTAFRDYVDAIIDGSSAATEKTAFDAAYTEAHLLALRDREALYVFSALNTNFSREIESFKSQDVAYKAYQEKLKAQDNTPPPKQEPPKKRPPRHYKL